MSPIILITALRESDEYIKDIFMRGGCYQFHKFLGVIFPETKPYMSIQKDHVVSLINGKLYDINGEIPKGQWINYEPFANGDYSLVKSWSFAAHNMIYISECVGCGEPFTI